MSNAMVMTMVSDVVDEANRLVRASFNNAILFQLTNDI